MNIRLVLLISVICFCLGFAIQFFRQREIDSKNLEKLEQQEQELELKISLLEEHKNKLSFSIEELNQAQEKQLSKGLEKIGKDLEDKKRLASQQLANWQKECEEEYLSTLADFASHYQQETKTKQLEIAEFEARLDELHELVAMAVEANKRELEKTQQQNFYRLNIPEKDLEEIKQLRQVSGLLRDKEPLNKVIWKVYYEKPTNDLIGRVIGPGAHSGIYKITNLQNQMCYVGQSVNLSDRWKQHIKRGIGADTPTKNKLYPALEAFGVENFSFEVIEKCPKDKLDDREKFWTQYFHAQDFGYSIRSG